ncbi:MAG TPA: carotenoid 1,2-hydratase [Rhodocyclaceae bacterium]|nr:carotenoid 1,2-hydratase [Rhodocyclaceae bacterium]
MGRLLAAVLLALLSCLAGAVDYPPVAAGRPLAFPRDFGSHPDFRNEWWYVTGWAKDREGRDYGFQVTFFRHRPGVAEDNASAFAPRQLLFAHVALTDAAGGRLHHDQRAARAGFGLAEAKVGDTGAWIGDWRLERQGETYRARIAARDFALELDFSPTQGPMLQGEGGYSRKGPLPRQASYYYSLPHLAVSGAVAVDGQRRPVSGTAWLDHEWSSEGLAPGAVGWDWVGINLKNGGALMAFRLRDRSGATLWTAGSWRDPHGEVRVFAPGEVAFTPRRRWRSTASGAEYPVAMAVRVPGLALDLEPLVDDQEVDGRRSTRAIYWEGAVRAFRDGQEAGVGYLELTGYWQPLKL